VRGKIPLVDNAEVVRNWIQATNDGDLRRLLDLADPEFEMVEASELPGAAHVRGLEELRTYFYGWARNWSHTDWREEEIAEIPPDCVLLLATLRLRGLRSGADVERRWAYVFKVRNGRVLRQIGYDTKDQALSALSSL
jgi:ketosteroid isomerase-like protein